jgi:hypothetical protein
LSLEVVPTQQGIPTASPAERRFRALLEVVRGRRRPLIQLQHNPAPTRSGAGAR